MARILFDAFYHMMPGHRIAKNISVGGYRVNNGRYTINDCYHPNGLCFLNANLAKEFDISMLTEPYSNASLFDADILFIVNPDYPLYEGTSPYRWTPDDVDALMNFLNRGGGVLLLINSFLSRPDFWEENFDHERIGLLLGRLGIEWDDNYMSNDSIIEPAASAQYKVGYGQGGRVKGGVLPEGITPLLTYQGNTYGFETDVGKGKLVVLGDAGMISNGLLCFPGFDNEAFTMEVINKLKPVWLDSAIKKWSYESYCSISAGVSKTGLSEDVIISMNPHGDFVQDHHYRHITWEPETIRGLGNEVWRKVPISLDGIESLNTIKSKINWLGLDALSSGPECDITLTVNSTKGKYGTDIHVIGKNISRSLSWSDLSTQPNQFVNAGTIEETHTVFNMKLVQDKDNRNKCVKWSQGQILYARNTKSAHYGYEIILCSKNGIIAPGC